MLSAWEACPALNCLSWPAGQRRTLARGDGAAVAGKRGGFSAPVKYDGGRPGVEFSSEPALWPGLLYARVLGI